MSARLGYLLPTREKIMAGEPATKPLLDLAARAERLGFDAMYLNIVLDDDVGRANDKLDRFLEAYYGQPVAVLRQRQMGYAGPAAGVAEWLNDYVRAGCSHLVLRFTGEHERNLETLAALREQIV